MTIFDPGLAKKLGIKQGMNVICVDAPEGFHMAVAGDLQTNAGALADRLIVFSKSTHELSQRLDEYRATIEADGGLWICWPKKASKVATDISADWLRAVLLPTGLVDNKICSIDETWTAIQFVWRIEYRPERER